MSEIVVSICCITYNQIHYIEDTIQSFLNQQVTFPIEILIQDDCSNDGTWEIIKEYQEKYPLLIKGYQNEYNRHNKHENVLFHVLLKAKGEYISVCEGDDYWVENTKLQKQLLYMKNHKECTFLCSSAHYVNHYGEKVNEFKEVKENLKFTMNDLLENSWCFPTASYFFPKKCLNHKMKFYDVALPVEDIPLQMLCTLQGYGYFMKDRFCAYRQNSMGSWNNTVKKIKDKRIQHHENMIKMYKTFDSDTRGKYSKGVEKAIIIEKFNLVLSKEEYTKLRSPEYKRFIKSLHISVQVRLRYASYFPKSYAIMKLLYEKLRRSIS